MIARMQVCHRKCANPKVAVVILRSFAKIIIAQQLVTEPYFATEREVDISRLREGNVFQRLPPCTGPGRRFSKIGIVLVVPNRADCRRIGAEGHRGEGHCISSKMAAQIRSTSEQRFHELIIASSTQMRGCKRVIRWC